MLRPDKDSRLTYSVHLLWHLSLRIPKVSEKISYPARSKYSIRSSLHSAHEASPLQSLGLGACLGLLVNYFALLKDLFSLVGYWQSHFPRAISIPKSNLKRYIWFFFTAFMRLDFASF